jgi:signal transduction histidine kinase/CheY-like chemotaxis protein
MIDSKKHQIDSQTVTFATGFEAETRVSLKSLIRLLLIASILVFFLSITPSDLMARYKVMALGALMAGVAAAAWKLEKEREQLARWFVSLSLALLIIGAGYWLSMPALLLLLVLPPMLGALLISPAAGVILAVGETAILLFFIGAAPAAGVSPGAVELLILTIWAALGASILSVLATQRTARWSWRYYQQARAWMEEAQESKTETAQALENLERANLQLTRLNNLAQNLRQIAEDAQATKSRFVANVSHELRTPLNMVIGFSEMILQAPETYGEKIPSALLADLDVIHRNAEHLSDLIDDVLDLSQIDAEEVALAKEMVELRKIIDAAVTAVRPLYETKNLYLEIAIPEDLPAIFCDPTRIREVILNLLSNAGRYTDEGGVSIQARQDANEIIVAIADTGAGIADADMDKLFQPFQQVGDTPRHYGGTGLGLSISKHFIELHEGKIWVESKQGIGTTFFFSLPLQPPIAIDDSNIRWLMTDWEYQAHLPTPEAPRSLIHPRFVVVETGDTLKRMLAHYSNDVEIVAAKDMQEAMREISETPADALLINDIAMTTNLWQLNQVMPDGAPAILCSIPGTHEASIELGAEDCLVKPISRQMLLDALTRLHVAGGEILVVDDDPDALQLFGRLIASLGSGYHVLQARDGEEALSILQQHRPNVILLDLIMPNLDGFQFLEIRERDPALGEIPVIIISALDPANQSSMSMALALTQKGGLTMPQLLRSIEALSGILSIANQPNGSRPPKGLPG